MKLSQEQIDKIYKIFEWAASIIFIGGLVLLMVLPKDVVSSNAFLTWLGLFFGSAIIAGIARNWATDEEAEEKKKLIKEAMQELQAEELKKKRNIPADERIKSPLKGLTPHQEDAIMDLLRNKIWVENNRLKTAELKHLLISLQRQGNLDDSDMDRVIAWVRQVTGYEVDERNLKYDYTSKFSEREIVKWGDKIRDAYDRIEIS